MADKKFTFWENMKETIEKYTDPVFKYKCYDALTEYALYQTLPEADGSFETEVLISLCQGFTKALQTNWDYEEGQEEKSTKGGKNLTYKEEDLIKAIEEIGIEKEGQKVSWEDCARKYKELFDENSKIVGKTFSRRFSEEKRDNIIQEAIKKKNNLNFGGFDF